MSLMNKLSLLPTSLKLLTVVGAAMAMSGTANAQTDAGSTVSNTFTLDYSVNSTPQNQITNEDGDAGDPDGPTIFTVDRLIDLTVVQTSGEVFVTPGATAANAQLTFNVTNTGNDNQSYSFSLDDTTFDNDFDFDPTTQVITVSVAGETDLDVTPVALDTAAATAGNFSADIAPGETFTVTISGNIPVAAANAAIDEIALVVETRDPTAYLVDPTVPVAGTLTEAVNGPDGTGDNNVLVGVAQNVFSDGDSDDTAFVAGGNIDVDLNGVAHDVGRFIIATPSVTGVKTVEVVSTDGSGCASFATPTDTLGQFAVPGACVEYVITVENLGADGATGGVGDLPATDITVADTLPAELIFIAATVEDFTVAPTPTAPGLPAANADCAAVACLVSFEGGTIAEPGNAAGDPTVARVRIRALIQ